MNNFGNSIPLLRCIEFVRAFASTSIHKILYIIGSLVFIELVMRGDQSLFTGFEAWK